MPDLGSDLLLLMKEGFSHDFTLICEGGKQLMVHRFILAARSVVFRGMMELDMKEKRTGIVEIKDVDPEVVTEFINYVYSDKISDDFINLTELLMIGHKYQVSSLIEECSKKLAKEVSLDNVVDLGILAEDHNASELSDKCAEFMSENYGEINFKKQDMVPGSLLNKTQIAHRKKSAEKSPVAVETKNIYLANLTKTPRPTEATKLVHVKDDPIETRFKVSRNVKLVGMGLYLSMENMSVALGLADGGLEHLMTIKTAASSTDWSKPLKIMFPVPIEVGPGGTYILRMIAESGCVLFQDSDPPPEEVNLAMMNGDLKVINVDPAYNMRIPLLYFED